MKFFSYFQSLGFTRNETKVILLLCSTLLLGLAFRYYNSSSEDRKPPEKGFDYTIPDSIFQELSAAPGPSSKAVDSTGHSSGKSAKLDANSPVNINTATPEELVQLPGIGPAYAERIIRYRKENGPFTSVAELENVKGIGKKRLARLRPFVRIK